MWLGLLLRERADGDCDLVTLCAWGPDPQTAIRITGTPTGMPECARLLRGTIGFGACFAPPRCPHCRTPLDVPGFDAERERAA